MKFNDRRRFIITKNDPIIMTSESNPEVLAICYAQGWCARSDRMYQQEAKAVTSIGTAFQYSNITHFEEFQYFTGITTGVNYGFRNCENLTTITLPESFVGIINYALFLNCTSLTEINIPSGVTGFHQTVIYGIMPQ